MYCRDFDTRVKSRGLRSPGAIVCQDVIPGATRSPRSLASTFLQHVNELSMKLDVEDILRRADAIALQLADCKVTTHLTPVFHDAVSLFPFLTFLF